MSVELKITMDGQGQIAVTGPIDNIILCYGLLEAAKEVLQKHREKIAARIVPAAVIPKGNGGS